ncbi:hypothetical protein [Streptosporangium roseum]|uniref:hypothetical protein n=1 Tax=Streptosporangium roseum TaxID=2001 RepID=UPI0004CCC62B|nr:hypothetical protein [Streptosporangium roseum]
MQWWEFTDAVVIAHHPCRRDPALADIVVGAGVKQDGRTVAEPPASPRFELFAGITAGDGAAGRCLRVDGLSAPREAPQEIPMELPGCEPTRHPDRPGGVHHLDGRFVTDMPGLHCAMDEALVGPGGDVGRSRTVCAADPAWQEPSR